MASYGEQLRCRRYCEGRCKPASSRLPAVHNGKSATTTRVTPFHLVVPKTRKPRREVTTHTIVGGFLRELVSFRGSIHGSIKSYLVPKILSPPGSPAKVMCLQKPSLVTFYTTTNNSDFVSVKHCSTTDAIHQRGRRAEGCMSCCNFIRSHKALQLSGPTTLLETAISELQVMHLLHTYFQKGHKRKNTTIHWISISTALHI